MADNTVRIDGNDVALSHLDKVLYPDDGITKGDIVDHYRAVASVILPHLANRPLNLYRAPDGIGRAGFFQQHADRHVPDWVRTVDVPARGAGRPVRHVVCQDEATLVYLANLAGLELHRWLATSPAFTPDLLVIDLDPPESASVQDLRAAARTVRDALDDAGLVPFVQTTGGRGFHVVAPLDGSADEDVVRPAVRALADRIAETAPEKLTTEQRKAGRGDRIFLDTNRNGYGQTAVAPYSPRARPGAPVATPIEWDELGRVTPDRYTIRDIRKRLAHKEDPWRDMREHARPLGRLAERVPE